MKWNNVELVDGKFYVVDVSSSRRFFDDSSWVFAFNDDGSGRFTICHVCVKIHDGDTRRRTSIFGGGVICHNNEIKNIRPATREEMDYFWDYISSLDYKYSLNTKRFRYVGSR